MTGDTDNQLPPESVVAEAAKDIPTPLLPTFSVSEPAPTNESDEVERVRLGKSPTTSLTPITCGVFDAPGADIVRVPLYWPALIPEVETETPIVAGVVP